MSFNNENEITIHYWGSAKKISKNQKEWIIKGLIDTMPNHDILNYFYNKKHILNDADHVSTSSINNTCVGLVAMTEHKVCNYFTCYIETVFISEKLHGSSLFFNLIRSIINGIYSKIKTFPDFICMKTYNPKTYILMRYFIKNNNSIFYPNILNKNSIELQKLAKEIILIVSTEYNLDVSKGIVKGGAGKISNNFWKTRPLSKKNEINNFFINELQSNDRLFCFIDARNNDVKHNILNLLKIN